jgi:hypothetical protein
MHTEITITRYVLFSGRPGDFYQRGLAVLIGIGGDNCFVLMVVLSVNCSLEVFVDLVRQIVQISILVLYFVLVQLRFEWLTTYSGVI